MHGLIIDSKRSCGHYMDERIRPGMQQAVICSLLTTRDIVEYRKVFQSTVYRSNEYYSFDFVLETSKFWRLVFIRSFWVLRGYWGGNEMIVRLYWGDTGELWRGYWGAMEGILRRYWIQCVYYDVQKSFIFWWHMLSIIFVFCRVPLSSMAQTSCLQKITDLGY